MRFILTLLLSGVFASAATAQMSPEEAMKLLKPGKPLRAEKPKQDPDRLRIGGWNIEWLGTPQSRGGKANDVEQNKVVISEYLMHSNVDVLALAEIRPEKGGDRTQGQQSDILTGVFERLTLKTGQRWEYVLFPVPRYSGGQLTGIAWNTDRVTPVGDWRMVHPEPDPETTAGPRPSHAMMFTAGKGLTDFLVIPIHWKSDYRGESVERRDGEVKELVAGLKTFDDPDVIIIGDSNCGTTKEPAIARLREIGFIDLNADDRKTDYRDRYALDRAFVPLKQPEFADSGFEIMTMPGLTPELFKRRLSDHYMVVTTIQVTEDDD